jgi:hypothetical protein
LLLENEDIFGQGDQVMLTIRRKGLFWLSIAMLFVGASLGLIQPYANYCESNYANQYYCAAYEMMMSFGTFVDAHNGAITAIATAFIGLFTFTIWHVNNSQLAHAHQVERAYLSGGGVLEIEIVKPAIPPGGLNLPSRKIPLFELHINNHGKTPGRLLEIGFNACEDNAIPEIPDYQWRHCFDWIGPGTQSRRYGTIPVPPNLRNPIVYARFRYCDIFGDEHSCGFIQRGGEPIRAPDAYTDWN